MNAVLSGETATAAVPAGQPEPLTVAISITILSGGAGKPAADAGVDNAGVHNAAIALHVTSTLDMALPGGRRGPCSGARDLPGGFRAEGCGGDSDTRQCGARESADECVINSTGRYRSQYKPFGRQMEIGRSARAADRRKSA
ncbi:hypothetical protein GCM10010219_10530 [Streptomyces netropsis]|nr:hypothetical protein GCM10010219_10530 [Streptomyces netropsis]